MLFSLIGRLAESPLAQRAAAEGIEQAVRLTGTEKLAAEAAEEMQKGWQAIKTAAGWPQRASSSALEEAMATKPITFRQRLSDLPGKSLSTGYIETDGGKVQPLVVRSFPQMQPGSSAGSRIQAELTAFRVHQDSPFNTRVPVTVWRPNDALLVQERVGNALSQRRLIMRGRTEGLNLRRQDAAAMSWFSRTRQIEEFDNFAGLLSDKHSPLHLPLQEIGAERSLFGNGDMHIHNVGMTSLRGKIDLANLDWEWAFPAANEPPAMVPYAGQKIAQPVLDKIQSAVDAYDTPPGRWFLSSVGLNRYQIDSMLSRGRWLLDKEHFRMPGEF